MQTVFNQFSQVLGITLLHSLWQGLIIYALLRIVLMSIPSASAANKYNVGLLALSASVIWPVVTLLIEVGKYQTPALSNESSYPPFDLAFTPHHYPAVASNTLSITIEHYMPYLVVFWVIGILLQSVRLLLGWRNIYRIKQNLTAIPALAASVKLITQLLQLGKKTEVFLSDSIDVPCIIGYFKPIIIIPTAMITQFTAEQINSILVHELSHVRRNDYLINVLQQVIGILFFFNPSTHLINKIIYSEREHACDDLVLQITGQPLVYAQTLLQIEETRSHNIQLALAVTGKKYHLLNRIKRIMETKKQVSNMRHILAAVLLLLGSMGTIAWLNPEIKDGKVSIKVAGLPSLSTFLNDTARTVKKSAKPKTAGTVKKLKGKDRINNFDYNDPQLDKLTEAVNKHSEAISKYYDSDDFKKMQDELDKKSAALQAYFDKPEIKDMQAKQEKLSQEFQAKWGNADEQDNIYAMITQLGMQFNKYINTPEFKQLDKRLQKKYNYKPLTNPQFPGMRMPDLNNKNYAQYKKELDENMPADIQTALAKMQVLEKQRKVYNKSPDAQNQELRALADSMRKTFNNPQIKQTEQEMKKLADAMRAYQNNPEIKKEQQLLKTLAAKLTAYTNSPAFKKWVEQMKKIEVYRYDHTEKPEMPEKPEKPEKEEKPEQIENN